MAERELECDLVMRGGITSGVVYPGAVRELSKTYRFRSIGGTSAGALAAAITAAAEFGARHGDATAFEQIATIPEELGGEVAGQPRLLSLFQPQRGTRPLFRFLLAMLGRTASDADRDPSTLRRALGATRALLGSFSWAAFLFAAATAAGFLLLLAILRSLTGVAVDEWSPDTAFLLLLLVLLSLAAAIGGALRAAVTTAAKTLPANYFGICTGKTTDAQAPALTDWLHDKIQRLSGRRADDRPLTFADLRAAPGGPAGEASIDLVLITTNITQGISHSFPEIEAGAGPLFFNARQMGEFLPDSVVDYLKATGRERRLSQRFFDSARLQALADRDLFPLPEGPRLPILLGARMSLSFPFLLSAVPLYAIRPAADQAAGLRVQTVWFSDGGLTTNFPIHIFDGPLPRRPTFAINLVYEDAELVEASEAPDSLPPEPSALEPATPPASLDEAGAAALARVWMPDSNDKGRIARYVEFAKPGKSGLAHLGGFFMALFDTARNWGDTQLALYPGFRDRIVNVRMFPGEGGMNLKMPPEDIAKLSLRGQMAGYLLAARFAGTTGGIDPQNGKAIRLSWDNHRWVRYRAFMAALESTLQRLNRAWTAAAPNGDFAALFARCRALAPSYNWSSRGQCDDAEARTAELLALGARETCFDRGSGRGRAPRPVFQLRGMPRSGPGS